MGRPDSAFLHHVASSVPVQSGHGKAAAQVKRLSPPCPKLSHTSIKGSSSAQCEEPQVAWFTRMWYQSPCDVH